MLGKEKHKIVLCSVISGFLLFGCSDATDTNRVEKSQKITGETQGTTYNITLVDSDRTIKKSEIDSVLRAFDLSLSGYISSSNISQFNSSSTSFSFPEDDPFFWNCYAASKRIFDQTDGAFDPSVFPLVELWGFMEKVMDPPSVQQVDSVLQFIGFEKDRFHVVESDKRTIKKIDSRFKLDFNAIAQGYSVDVIGDYLNKQKCKNYFIEIGGEILVLGKNSEGKSWRLGIDKPTMDNDGKTERIITNIISITTGGVATSGNYRNFYEKDGKIYAHTLNPKTGYPAENEMLSATVLAKNATIADGMATAFMVLGLEKSKQYLQEHPDEKLEVLFVYRGNNNKMESFVTRGMSKKMQD